MKTTENDSMAGYTKLFSQIIHSSIWQEENDVKVVWISILALKDRNQICQATIPSLAAMAKISNERCAQIMEQFQAPDPWSNSQEHEGRRIEKAPTGWFVLNGARYRDMMNPDEVREYNRAKKAEERARKKNPLGKQSPNMRSTMTPRPPATGKARA